MLSSKDLYSQEPKNLVPYDVSKLKVAKGRVVPQNALQFLPPSAAALLSQYQQHIEMEPARLDSITETSDPIRPYWDPILQIPGTRPKPFTRGNVPNNSTWLLRTKSAFHVTEVVGPAGKREAVR